MIVKDNFLEEISQPSHIVGATIAGLVTLGVASTMVKFAYPGSLVNKLKDFTKLQKKNFFVNITMTMFSLFRYYFFNPSNVQPSVVLGGMPLPAVEEISHAMSDRILNYRATGGIFLAQQEGGEQSLRIQGKAYGLKRYMFLAMLDLLFLYGSARVIDQFVEVISDTAKLVADTALKFPLTGSEEFDTTMYAEPMAEVDPWKVVEIYNLDEGREEAHLTFPIITRTKVYSNMYIETYEFTESVENGMNCLTYSIFFRKYLPKYPYKFQRLTNEHGKDIYYYASDQSDDVVHSIRFADTIMDIGFSTSIIMYRFLQFYEGNSPEKNIAHITAINLSNYYRGVDNTGKLLQLIDEDLDYDLSELSIPQKVELMALD